MASPGAHLIASVQRLTRRHPDLWDTYDAAAHDAIAAGLVGPPWCCPPIEVAEQALDVVGGPREEAELVLSLASWRRTRRVYEFDVGATKLLEDIRAQPGGHLRRLPEPCVYVSAASKLRLGPMPAMVGFFARLEWNRTLAREELHLLLDTKRGFVPMPFPLVADTYEGCARAWVDEVIRSGAPTQHRRRLLSAHLAVLPLLGLVEALAGHPDFALVETRSSPRYTTVAVMAAGSLH